MNMYAMIKLVHILSAAVLFGTGIGIAFFLLRAHQIKDPHAFATISRQVVLADWLFTTPAVIVQLATGIWLTQELQINVYSIWFVSVISLFVFVGLCWLPVVWIQIRLTKLASDAHGGVQYRKLIKTWIALGVPAFSAM